MSGALRDRLEFAQLLLSIAVVVILAIDMRGQPARTVPMLTLLAGAFSAGVALGRRAERHRLERARGGRRSEMAMAETAMAEMTMAETAMADMAAADTAAAETVFPDQPAGGR